MRCYYYINKIKCISANERKLSSSELYPKTLFSLKYVGLVGVVGTFIGCRRNINVFNLADGIAITPCSCK